MEELDDFHDTWSLILVTYEKIPRSSEKRLWNMKKEDEEMVDVSSLWNILVMNGSEDRYGKTNKKKLWDFAVFFSFLSKMVGKKKD